MSAVLLAGMAARPLPPALFQPLVKLALGAVRRRYPDVFARLEPLADTAFLIDPVDLPFKFLLRPGARPPSLTVLRDDDRASQMAAIISGPLLSLIEVLEGRADGDALFFSRDLAVEGETEAVLTLRNAVDGAEIDMIEVVASAVGPFGGAARRLAGPVGAVFRRMNRDLEFLQAAVLAPLTKRCDSQAAKLAELDDKAAEPPRRARPGRTTRRAQGQTGALRR
ncbi:MAG: SCP2 domain-containing protein [Kiloniellaceae bacterium]